MADKEDQLDEQQDGQSVGDSDGAAKEPLVTESSESETEDQISDSAEQSDDTDVKEKLVRVGTVIAFSVLLYFEVVYGVLITVFVCLIAFLLKGEVPEKIAKFTSAASQVLRGTMEYVLFQTEKKPWPLQPWPKDSDED